MDKMLKKGKDRRNTIWFIRSKENEPKHIDIALKEFNEWVKEWEKLEGSIIAEKEMPDFENELSPEKIIVSAGKNTNDGIKWSDKNITVDLKNI